MKKVVRKTETGNVFWLGVVFSVLLFFQFFPDQRYAAEIYKYRDMNGTLHFTDDPGSIPEGCKVLKVFGAEEENGGNFSNASLRKQSSSQDDVIISILDNLVKVYHATHTYSQKDFFVCADMAMDVWNMVETKGINARIAAGNVNRDLANWKEYNHAWVVAEVSSERWVAMEITGGTIVRGNENRNYYRGYFLDSPRELKEYVDLKKRGRDLAIRTQSLQDQLRDVKKEYDDDLNKHRDLVDECEKKYPDQRLSKTRFENYRELRGKISQQSTEVKELEGKGKQLMGIIEKNVEELKKIERCLNKPVETLRFN